ncbi:pyrin-like [Electrophorus electricus]|uniref:pyrin-like n=1 Tax=Electrophorus electricus TaxID=8005 RepID=UPI0015CFD07B|nr:pyrin-like [Electrophorus electricus]XP_035390818.1 pyrin-like [Electrophorus electricus]XP_035390819.1 pyrin-like [Electrophorus electricus]
MANIKEHLLNTLEELATEDLKMFQWHLTNNVEDDKHIPKSRLEKADRHDTVDNMVQKYGQIGAVEITLDILKKMNNNQLAEELRTKVKNN